MGGEPPEGRTRAALKQVRHEMLKCGETGYIRRPFTPEEDRIILTRGSREAARELGGSGLRFKCGGGCC